MFTIGVSIEYDYVVNVVGPFQLHPPPKVIAPDLRARK